jgi:hypothetical protein
MNRRHLDSLKWSLQALASSPESQVALFPSYVVVADELALNFDSALRDVQSNRIALTAEQSEALRRLDAEIEAHSGEKWPQVWLEPNCLAHPVWSIFRSLASQALTSFGWEMEIPHHANGIYIGPPDA